MRRAIVQARTWFPALPLGLMLLALDNVKAEPISIKVIEGQNAINNVTRNTAYEPVVEVTGESGQPIDGAAVTFILPATGAGATFRDGGRTSIVPTDSAGRATARGLRPNNQIGSFEIRVTASHGGQSASAIINQTNAAPAVTRSRQGKKWAILLGLIGGGAAAAAVAASGGGGSSRNGNVPATSATDPPAGTITPGAPTFGSPR